MQLHDGAAWVTLDRPPLNVLDIDTLRQLNRTLREIGASSSRVVVIRSGLDRTFSAGVDIRDHTAARLEALFAEVREQVRMLLTMEAVTIAAVNGSALGGGAELALLCDLVILSEDARLSLPEVSLAGFPPIAAALCPDRLPWQVAVRLMLDEGMTAQTLRQLGIVSEVVPVERLQQAVERKARTIAALSGIGLRAMLASTRRRLAPAVLQRLDDAIATYKEVVGPSRDGQEGIDAFLEKRAPSWSHR